MGGWLIFVDDTAASEDGTGWLRCRLGSHSRYLCVMYNLRACARWIFSVRGNARTLNCDTLPRSIGWLFEVVDGFGWLAGVARAPAPCHASRKRGACHNVGKHSRSLGRLPERTRSRLNDSPSRRGDIRMP